MFKEKNKRKSKNFIIVEIVLIATVFIIALVLYWYLTTVEIEDPIATMKNNFLNMQLQSVGITTMATAIVIIFTKDKRKKIRNLVIVLIIAIIMIIAQIGAKIYMNNIYDEEKFEQFYEINKKEEDDQYYKDISISISGIKIIGAKESYVEKSINAYNIFKIKTTIFIMIHILIVLLICYILNKLIIFERKKSKVVKDEIFYGK